jgi:hypothetical protein
MVFPRPRREPGAGAASRCGALAGLHQPTVVAGILLVTGLRDKKHNATAPPDKNLCNSEALQMAALFQVVLGLAIVTRASARKACSIRGDPRTDGCRCAHDVDVEAAAANTAPLRRSRGHHPRYFREYGRSWV